MSDRQRWTELADDLGLTFEPGVRGMLDSKIASRIATQQGHDPAQIEAVKNNSLIMAVLERVFLGVAMGSYEGYEFFVYRNSRSQSSSASASYSVHVQLFFPESAELGLSIYRESFWSKVGKFLGAQDLQTGNAELDPLVMIKAKDQDRAQLMLGEASLQRALLQLFRHSDGFEVDDDGIEHRTGGESILPAHVVQGLMDRMVEAAEVIRPAIGI